MQPDPYHAVPEEKRNINGFRILPSGALVTDTPPFDRLFEEGTGNGLYALAVSNWETVPDPGAFFIKNMARQALTRMAHAAAERPDEVDTVLDHLLASATEKAFLAEQFPPVPGAEYATPDIIAGWFEDLRKAIAKEIRVRGITPAEWLNSLGAPWNQIGKVFFHLAENRDDATGSRPFAFMATFAHQSAADNQVRHLPLATALKLHEGNYTALLALLQPLKEAARESPLLKRLLDNGKIYTPMAWSAPEARDFLQDTPVYERAGIIVRMVNLWKKTPPKLQVKVTADASGSETTVHSSGLSVRRLLKFSVSATLGGKDLTPEELGELLSNGDGLIRFKGEWVCVDARKVRDLMDRWTQAARMMSSLGIPLVQGLRMLVNGPSGQLVQIPEPDEDCVMEPGQNLRQTLDILAGKVPVSIPELPSRLDALMRPYQKEGFSFLYRITERGFGACLADDMGLGKTLQAIAWLDALRRKGRLEGLPALIVAPASLLSNWKEEAQRFAPELILRIMHPSSPDPWQPENTLRRKDCHAVITTYGMAARTSALADLHFPAIILDEAQAIKNAGSARSRAIRSLHGERRIALSGTPVENNLNELWSLMEFLNPGLLGSRKSFESFTRSLERGYAPLRRLVRPFILRRMKTDPALVPDLPDKMEIPAYCSLTPEQAALYLVHEEKDALFAAERFNALGVFGVHGADAAFALYDFDEYGGGFGRNRGLKYAQIAPRHGLEAVRDRREPVLKTLLPSGGHRRIRAAVERLVQRNDFVGVDVLHPLHVAAGQLDLRFVGFRAGVAEERLSKMAQGQQFLGQFKLFFLIEKVAHMDELAGLFLDDLSDFLVAVAEAGYRDPGQQVDVFLAVEVGDSGTFAAGDADRVTTVRPAEKGFFAGLDRIERGSGHDGISCPAAAGMLI